MHVGLLPWTHFASKTIHPAIFARHAAELRICTLPIPLILLEESVRIVSHLPWMQIDWLLCKCYCIPDGKWKEKEKSRRNQCKCFGLQPQNDLACKLVKLRCRYQHLIEWNGLLSLRKSKSISGRQALCMGCYSEQCTNTTYLQRLDIRYATLAIYSFYLDLPSVFDFMLPRSRDSPLSDHVFSDR